MLKNIFCLSLILTSLNIYPCTTVVVSGKATADGRPLLLKNRDADELQNRLAFFNDGMLSYIGLVNSSDSLNENVWVGFNSAGFAIMNSASYNLKKSSDTTRISDLEGILMKRALMVCKSIEDFERMLGEMPKPLGVEANFGVIDANGGAAYYEVDNFSYVKYDVNDPSVAPNGYLIRTNFSFAGDDNKGYGYIRYSTAFDLMNKEYKKDKISYEFLVRDLPRCLIHSFTKTNLEDSLPEKYDDTSYVNFRDYIPRYYSSSAIVVQGVKKEEPPSYAVMWSAVGFPLTSVVVPVWILDDGVLPKILVADSKNNSKMCELSLNLKERVFSEQHDAKDNYLNLASLINKEKTGVRQKLIPVEEEVLSKAKDMISGWNGDSINKEEIKNFYNWIDSYIPEEVGIILQSNK